MTKTHTKLILEMGPRGLYWITKKVILEISTAIDKNNRFLVLSNKFPDIQPLFAFKQTYITSLIL